mgnify:CR=1 FL=1
MCATGLQAGDIRGIVRYNSHSTKQREKSIDGPAPYIQYIATTNLPSGQALAGYGHGFPCPVMQGTLTCQTRSRATPQSNTHTCARPIRPRLSTPITPRATGRYSPPGLIPDHTVSCRTPHNSQHTERLPLNISLRSRSPKRIQSLSI